MTWIIGGGLVGLIAFILNNNREQDKKIGRSYERLDETKKYQDETFVRRDICMILHKQIAADLVEIKTDVKLLLSDSVRYEGHASIRGPKGDKGRDGKDA